MTTDTEIALGFVQGSHIETLLSMVFVTPSTADWLLCRGKPFTLIQCHNSGTPKMAGRSFTLSFHLNSSCFFPKSHPPYATCIKCTCKVPVLKSCAGFEDGDKQLSMETKLVSSGYHHRKEKRWVHWQKDAWHCQTPQISQTNILEKVLAENARKNLGKIFVIWVIRRLQNTSLSA